LLKSVCVAARSDRQNFLKTCVRYNFIKKKSRFKLSELLENIDFIIDPFFTPEELNQLARKTQFVHRKGKIDGSLFFDLIVFHSEALKSQSLNDLSASFKVKNHIEITKQSLHERFNKNALDFLKEALKRMLKKQLTTPQIKSPKSFNRILIKDSTCFQVDESFVKDYPGSGGGGSKASIRIQFEYDVLSGNINDLSINAFNEQDAKDSLATINLTRMGDLIIRDLAYMSLAVLQLIETWTAYYLCRTSPSVHVFEKQNDNEYHMMDFVTIQQYMKKHGLNCLEKEAYLGKKEKFTTRLIICLLPEEEVAKRIRKAEFNNKKKKSKKPLSKEYKARAALNLFVTNANSDEIPMEKVWSLYRLRWQIELIFKIWKSVCHIEKVKKVKQHRLECYIFSKLILIVLAWQILWRTAQNLFLREGKALSFFKSSKTLFSLKIDELREIFILRKSTMETFMKNFYSLSRSNHLLEKRSKKPTSQELLLDCLRG